MNVRQLSKALQEKAEKELNEIPNQVAKNLEQFKEWLEKQEYIRYRNDDQFLLNFLRTSKFSLERAKQKLDDYYTYRTLAPEITRNLDPLLPEIQAAIRAGVCTPLPIAVESPTDARVYMMRTEDYDPDVVTVITMLKLGTIGLDIIINEEDTAIVSGVKAVWDLKGLQFRSAAQLTPTLLKKIAYFFLKACPCRVKALYLINIPKFMEQPLKILKMAMSKKLAGRVHLYSTNNLEEIYKDIPKSIMPKEYGGDAGYAKDLAEQWRIRLERQRDKLLNEDNYFTDEDKRPGQANTAENLFGVEGSFRKLEVD